MTMPLSPTKPQQKRRKSKWRDKVKATVTTVQSPPSEICEQTLTRCQRCPPHRNKPGKFRILIDDGCYLCDACYRREFPATAMLDDESDFQRNVKQIRHRVADGVRDHVIEATKAASLAVNMGDSNGNDASSSSLSFSSEVECRMCLDKGAFRRCCKSYYCHQCYFQSGHCPKCKKETPLTGLAAGVREEPGKVAVGFSWAISALIVAIAITALALFYWNASTLPVTISGYQCGGWLPTCNLAVCIEYHVGFLSASQPYKECNRSASSQQVIASACVFDWEAYIWSNNSFGYDLCISSPREVRSRSTNISSSDPLLLFSNDRAGVYVFDDDFEFPLKEASAPWQEIINGRYSDACGVNNNPSERGSHGGFRPLQNKNALVFGGKQRRHATTQGLNVENGGIIEFHLKLGPLIQDDPNSECQAAFEGDVILEYNVTDAWKTMGNYPAWKYRGEEFQFISESLPSEAWSNFTQFRIRQPTFDGMRDHWAIDDFRVLSRLHTPLHNEREMKQREDVMWTTCCLNTKKCSIFDKKRISFESEQCQNIGSTKTNARRRLKVYELLIVFTLLVALGKFLYRIMSVRFSRLGLVRTNHEQAARTDAVEGNATPFPRKKFETISCLSWQYSVTSLICGLLLLTISRLLQATMFFYCLRHRHIGDPSCRTDLSFYLVMAIAFWSDARIVVTLLMSEFCVENPWNRKAVEVEVDLHPDKRYMRIGTGVVPLSEITKLQEKGRLFSWFISSCYIFGGMPLALGSLTIQSFDSGPRLEALSTLLSSLAVLRESFGPSFVAKLCLSIGWVFAFRTDDRNEFGRAVMRRGLLQQFFAGSCLTPAVVMFTLLVRRVEYISSTDNLILFVLSAISGGFFGLLVGVFRGLSTSTEVYCTGWPGSCYTVTYYDKVKCPCIFSWNYCGEIHSRQVLLIISLDDMDGFRKCLMGNTSN